MPSPHDALHGSLAELLHFTVLDVHDGTATARLDVQPGMLQAAGVVHGGVLFTLADAVAANLGVAAAPSSRGATIDASIRYFRAVRSGVVTARAGILHRGRQTIQIEVRLEDDQRRLVAHYNLVTVDPDRRSAGLRPSPATYSRWLRPRCPTICRSHGAPQRRLGAGQ